MTIAGFSLIVVAAGLALSSGLIPQRDVPQIVLAFAVFVVGICGLGVVAVTNSIQVSICFWSCK